MICQIHSNSALAIAQRLYDEYPGLSKTGELGSDMVHFGEYGYLFMSAETIVMAEVWPEEHAWHVFLAIGRDAIKTLLVVMPYPMRYVTFVRRGKLRKYELERILRKVRHEKLVQEYC
jgi:hypothetical protein